MATTVRGIDGLAGEGEVLVERLRDGADATYHALYQVRRGEAVDATVEVWQRGARTRVDSSTPTGGTVAVFRDTKSNRTVTCTREGEAWTCENAPADDRGFDGFVEDAVNDLRGLEVTARDESIANLDVRCFSVVDQAEVCVTQQGVPARMAAGGSTTELIQLDQIVPRTVFDLPGTVAANS